MGKWLDDLDTLEPPESGGLSLTVGRTRLIGLRGIASVFTMAESEDSKLVTA
jgi:hypothetical protein